MKITEVYFRSSEKKPGQQWFEVYNDAQEPVNLRNALIKRLDGQKKQQAWAVVLPDEDWILEPEQYAVVAQRADLGQNLCSQHRVIVIKDSVFAFKSSGVQTLCIAPVGQPESCAKISDSKKTEEGFSRILLAGLWMNETCELIPGVAASPGLPMAFCEKNIESGWAVCSKPQAGEVRQTARHASSGCQTVSGMPTMGLELVGLLLVWLVIKCFANVS